LYQIKRQGISSLSSVKGALSVFPATFLLLIWKPALQKALVHCCALGNGAEFILGVDI